MSCPLCHSLSIKEYEQVGKINFMTCAECFLVFKAPQFYPSQHKEKSRYLLHENDVNDINYQRFVDPIVSAISKQYPPSSTGLDYGAGPGPVATKLLNDKGYSIALYDPFFHPNIEVLNIKYDFIICCEVIEHFHKPKKEFELLRKLLKPNGSLYCMTKLLPEKSEFKNWNYKNDLTHVVFYSEKNLQWIKEHYSFSEVNIENRLVVFKR